MLDTSAPVEIIVEYDNLGTMFAIGTTARELMDAEDAGTPLPLDRLRVVDTTTTTVTPHPGAFLCDCFWKVVSFEAVQIPLDLLALVCWVLCHIMPHRAYFMHCRMWQSSRAVALTKIADAMTEYEQLRRQKVAKLLD